MDAVVDAGMFRRWCQVFSIMWLVTKDFGFFISKGKNLCGRESCVLFICLGGMWSWLGDDCGVGASCLLA
jgi:hypothetical protein